MGEIISARASREDIVKDATRTLEAARARDEAWQAPAEERLAAPLEVYAGLRSETEGLASKVASLRYAVEKENESADTATVVEVEKLFTLGGRRRNDPWLAILAPGGAGGYTEGATGEQPLRMALFARLLRRLGHKRIDKADTDAAAKRIEAAAKPLAAAVAALEGPAAELALLDRVLTALARTLRMELVALKQGWKSAGFSEAEIHAVIPDRPSPVASTAPTTPVS